MKHVKLELIAYIQMGYSFRSSLTAVKNGVPVLQLRDLNPDGSINIDSIRKIEGEGLKEAHTLVEGDLVFRSRGLFTAGVFPKVGAKVMLASPLFKISVDTSVVLPQFLSWCINSPSGKSYFESVAEGSVIKMVSKSALSEMMIPLPPLSIQQEITEIAYMCLREKILSEQLLKKREQFVNYQIQRILGGGVLQFAPTIQQTLFEN